MKLLSKNIALKMTIVVLLFLTFGMTLCACSMSCRMPPKDARGNPTVLQHPDR
ncbi:MAG TPA: hypothetical protein VGJ94_18445 [Syntrophorhabdaceae bacterium]|jgi:hypothetical protein